MDSRIQNTTPASATAASGTTSSSDNGNSSFYRTDEAIVTDSGQWCITVCPTIGGHFQLQVSAQDTVDGLKKAIGKRLKIKREKISLLYRDRLLAVGTLLANGIHEDCKITLLPNVESGLVPPKPEHTVLQALENLSDSQVNAFLAGRSPLTLAMRLGEHMMFVQLQLSTSPPTLKHNHPPHRCLRKSAPHPQRVASVPSSMPPASGDLHSMPHGSFTRTPARSACCTSGAPADLRTTEAGLGTGPQIGGSTLSNAKQNLSQKLKEFSQAPKTQGDQAVETPAAQLTPSTSSSSIATPSPSSSSPYSPHAIIESMEQVGQGVYSGTFSGTLNPALQDNEGRPKRSISTIIHILNDLLGASPEYRAHRRARRIQRQDAAHPDKPSDCQRQSEENQATRGKMECLQMMLQERRNRRQARKDRRSCPYPPINCHPLSVDSSSQDGSTSFGFDTDMDAAANMADAGAHGFAQIMQENEAELTQGAVVV